MSSEAPVSFPLPTGFEVSTDVARLDVDYIDRFLRLESYWARDVTRDIVVTMIEKSLLCFGLYVSDGRQVGFARVVGDGVTFAYIADVFIDPSVRGQGLGKALFSTVIAHPFLNGIRRVLLATMDAHDLYAKFDFQPLVRPDRFMERLAPGVRDALKAAP
jgi:GNAT superfamily N-acetyltransferase